MRTSFNLTPVGLYPLKSSGHDTTASTIGFTLLDLANHPEHLRKCQEEIDELLKDRTDEDIAWYIIISRPTEGYVSSSFIVVYCVWT